MIRYFFFLFLLFINSTLATSNSYYIHPNSYKEIKDKYESLQCWGLHTTVDLYHCDPDLIRDPIVIERFVIMLCHLIDMKRFGDAVIVNFGEEERVAGYSMYQLIETSNISGHFSNQTNSAYLDIFSCKFYNPFIVMGFSKSFFGAEKVKINIIYRR